MLTTIKGIYDNGKIILTEEPRDKTKTEVIVTFLKEEKRKPSHKKQSRLGGMEGLITVPDNFDEPLDDLKEYMF
jgi:hypothetical protein